MSHPRQCEVCDHIETPDDTSLWQEVETIRGIKIWVCSDDCVQEHEDSICLARQEDARQVEMFGDDMDSWYR